MMFTHHSCMKNMKHESVSADRRGLLFVTGSAACRLNGVVLFSGVGAMTWSPLACGIISGKYDGRVPPYSRASLKVTGLCLSHSDRRCCLFTVSLCLSGCETSHTNYLCVFVSTLHMSTLYTCTPKPRIPSLLE